MMKFKRFITKAPLYIFLFAWYSILFLYSQNYIKLSFQVVLLPLLISTAIGLILLVIFRFIFKEWTKAGILAGALVLITFIYGPLHKMTNFGSFHIGVIPIKWNYLYLVFSVTLLVVTIILLIKVKRKLIRLAKILNLGSLGLLIVVLVPLVVSYSKVHLVANNTATSGQNKFSNSNSVSGKYSDNTIAKPDIYYIIPDDYGAPQTLKEDYGYDDSQFLSYLKSSGFYIADKSKTNYPFSAFMIASALNMDYLNSQTLPEIKFEPGGVIIDNALQDSKVLNFIKSQGYSYFHIGSWYDPLRYNDQADINFVYDNKLNLDDFSNTLLSNTIFYPLVLRFFGLSGRANQIANTNYQYQTLADMPNQVSPKFVFVDILSPHTPWIYNAECGLAGHGPGDLKIPEFLDQLSCVNQRLTATIDSILKNSKNPPIIILQTDEGAKDEDNQAIKYPNSEGVKGGFDDASVETDLERTRILSAFYLPGNHSNQLYSEISPVNTFRLVFDEYFNAKLPLLPDNIYTFDDYDKLYKFEFNDVTDEVKGK